MTDFDPNDILFTRDGTTATITLNRPDALNAITPAMLHRLGDLLDDLARMRMRLVQSSGIWLAPCRGPSSRHMRTTHSQALA